MMIACLVFFVFSAPLLSQVPDKDQWSEKSNSSGATLVLKETGRTQNNGQTVVSYRLFASGLPKDLDYTLLTRLVGLDPHAVANAFINNDGLLVNVLADPAHNIAEDPIDVRAVAGRGEPKQFALVSNDGRYRVFGQAVPFPIESAAGSCHISATMLAANYEFVLITVGGLAPKEELQVNVRSENEGRQNQATATDQGTYQVLTGTYVQGKPSGTARFEVSAKSCKVGLEFPWGKGSYKIQ